jgi:hypothetical protein
MLLDHSLDGLGLPRVAHPRGQGAFLLVLRVAVVVLGRFAQTDANPHRTFLPEPATPGNRCCLALAGLSVSPITDTVIKVMGL